jgi:SHS2 domain-containing protein
MKGRKAKAAIKEPQKGGKAKVTAPESVDGGNARRTNRTVSGPAAGRRESAPLVTEPEDIPREEAGWGEAGGSDIAEPPDSDESPARPAGFLESEKHIMELLEKEQSLCEPRTEGRAKARARSEKFRFLDHTADVGIQAYGETLCEAFENAALGMFNIITDPSKVGAQKDFEVTIEGADLKNLLHEWLDQLLILSQVNNMLFSSFKVDLKDLENGVGLTGLVMGEPADPSKHVYKTEIKAVTHHMLEVNEDPPMVRVLFDI